MGLFDAFKSFRKPVEVDQAKSDDTKARMRALFDAQVEEGPSYQVAYGFSEDIRGANFGFGRTLSYTYQNFILGFRDADTALVLLPVSPDLSESGELIRYTPETVKKTNYIAMTDQYYLQYGSSFKKEFFNLTVPKTLDDIVLLDFYDEDSFSYVDQEQEAAAWADFWRQFSK